MKQDRDTYYKNKLSPLKYEYLRQMAKTIIDLQDTSIKGFIQGLIIAEYHEYDQDILDELYRKYVKEADFTGVLHPQFKEWLDELHQKETTSTTENQALAEAILQKTAENQAKLKKKV